MTTNDRRLLASLEFAVFAEAIAAGPRAAVSLGRVATRRLARLADDAAAFNRAARATVAAAAQV